MSAVVAAGVPKNMDKLMLFKITGGAAANVTITHGLGAEPSRVIIVPIVSGATCVLISKSATAVVVLLSNGGEADVYLGL